jgi:hypothetical protein
MLDQIKELKCQIAAPSEPTVELKRFLARLPSSMVRRLTPEELAAYARALAPQRSPHWIDFKTSVPLPGLGIYVALMVGRERRSRERLRQEGQLRWGPYFAIAAVLAATVVTGWLASVLLIEGLTLMASDNRDVWWRAYTGSL